MRLFQQYCSYVSLNDLVAVHDATVPTFHAVLVEKKLAMLQAVAVGTFFVAEDPDNPLNESLLKYRLECYLQMFRTEGEFEAEGFGAVEDVDRDLLTKFKKMAGEISAELLALEKRVRDRLPNQSQTQNRKFESLSSCVQVHSETGESETEKSEAVPSEEKKELSQKKKELQLKIEGEEKKELSHVAALVHEFSLRDILEGRHAEGEP